MTNKALKAVAVVGTAALTALSVGVGSGFFGWPQTEADIPLLALVMFVCGIAVEAMPSKFDVPRVPLQKACAFCAEPILADALKCKHCGEFQDGSRSGRPSDADLSPSIESALHSENSTLSTDQGHNTEEPQRPEASPPALAESATNAGAVTRLPPGETAKPNEKRSTAGNRAVLIASLLVAVGALGWLGLRSYRQHEAVEALRECKLYDSQSRYIGAEIFCEIAMRADPSGATGREASAKRDEVIEKRRLETEQRLDALGLGSERVGAKAGGWATIFKPTSDPASRTEYVRNVSEAHPGEPKLNRPRAHSLAEGVRATLARVAGVSPDAIDVKLGQGSATLSVRGGVVSRIGNSEHDAFAAGVCSEPFFGTALADLVGGKGASVGLRSVMCASTGCTAVFDLRPTRPSGGGVYEGERCVTMADVVDMAARGLNQP